MKKTELQDLKSKPVDELRKLLKETNEKVRSLKFDREVGKVKNIHEIAKQRKYIARIHTFLKQQENK